jgi:bifunctional N-acetylglucosamine-1-phosphate-uridyltransferase/glucosamine-1-phosphate-acetyltransferase GlmU-like protein
MRAMERNKGTRVRTKDFELRQFVNDPNTKDIYSQCETLHWPISDTFLKRLSEAVGFNPDSCVNMKPWDIGKSVLDALSLNVRETKIDENAIIEKGVTIEGPVVICGGARIMSRSIIKGPAYIGPNALLGNYCLFRNSIVVGGSPQEINRPPNTCIGAYVEVANSIIGYDTKISSKISSTVVGNGCWIGGGVNISNQRLDLGHIRVFDGHELFNTQNISQGPIIGDNVNIGTGCTIYPGVMIGPKCTLFPGTIIELSIPDDLIIRPIQTCQITTRRKGGAFHRQNSKHE